MNHIVSFKSYRARWVSDKCTVYWNILNYITYKTCVNDFEWRCIKMELPWLIISVQFRATVTAFHPVDEIVPVIFPPFRHRSPKPPKAKREGNYRCRKTRAQDKTDFFTKRNMRAVLECLFVCWPVQKYPQMEHEYDVKNSYIVHCVRILKKACERTLKNLVMFLIHGLILNN